MSHLSPDSPRRSNPLARSPATNSSTVDGAALGCVSGTATISPRSEIDGKMAEPGKIGARGKRVTRWSKASLAFLPPRWL